MEPTPTPWDSWDEFERLQADTSQLCESFVRKLSRSEASPTPIGFVPNVDFIETNDDYRLFLSVPGLIEQDLDLSIEQDALVVRGERQPPYDSQRHQTHITEWRYGIFERRIELPGPIKPATLQPTYEAGVLTVVVAKSSR